MPAWSAATVGKMRVRFADAARQVEIFAPIVIERVFRSLYLPFPAALNCSASAFTMVGIYQDDFYCCGLGQNESRRCLLLYRTRKDLLDLSSHLFDSCGCVAVNSLVSSATFSIQ